MKFCPQCGSELNEGAKFCPSCGFQLKEPEQSPPPAPESEPSKSAQEPIQDQFKQATNVFSDAVTGKTNLIQRVINILTKPKEEWLVINSEQPNTLNLIVGYVLILALIPAIAVFIRSGIIGTTIWGITHRSIGTGISQALVALIGAGIGAYLFAWVIDLLAPSFDSEKNMGKSLQLACYSYTPVWVLGILNIFGGFGSLAIFLGALYSIYLLYLGIPVLKRTPHEKVTGYLVLSIIAMIAISVVVAMILGLFLGLFFVTNGGFRG